MKRNILLFLFCLFAGLTNSYSQKFLVFERDSFTVKYPSTWTIGKEDEYYDPDGMFSLYSPEDGCTILFMMMNLQVDVEYLLEEQERVIKRELIKKPTSISNFNSWGKFKGKGKLIKGTLLDVFNGSIKFFVYTNGNKTMMVIEQLYDSSSEKFLPDLISIADSFHFK